MGCGKSSLKCAKIGLRNDACSDTPKQIAKELCSDADRDRGVGRGLDQGSGSWSGRGSLDRDQGSITIQSVCATVTS